MVARRSATSAASLRFCSISRTVTPSWQRTGSLAPARARPARSCAAKNNLHHKSHVLYSLQYASQWGRNSMRRKSFSYMQCPIARSLERVGEWWSILILRDASLGLTRFDEFQESLGIAPNILTRRLKALVEAGLLERRRYSERPPRDEYVLTQAGRDFRPVLWALLAWGNKHFAPEGASVVVIDSKTGEEA